MKDLVTTLSCMIHEGEVMLIETSVRVEDNTVTDEDVNDLLIIMEGL